MVLKVGQRYNEAMRLLKLHGATDITAQVALKRSGRETLMYRERWFTLRDRTCITVVGSGKDAATLKVTELWIGKRGQGYPGMAGRWFTTARKVAEISL